MRDSLAKLVKSFNAQLGAIHASAPLHLMAPENSAPGTSFLAALHSRPSMIESKKSALFRSDDGGKTWNRLDASRFMIWRPFYFANLIVDPKDENKVFKTDGPLLLSVNGGQSFSSVGGGAHGDFHDIWIDPNDTNTVFTGDDGGLWLSQDGGTRWMHQANLPISQFYHVSVDNADPYHVYGGLQDNSSWCGPTATTNQLVEFLGLDPDPGLVERSLKSKHGRGPSDYKIDFAADIGPSSIGRGARLPKSLFPPQV